MAKSKIEITFNSIPQVGDLLILNNNLSAIDLSEVFVLFRDNNFKTKIGTSINECATLYYQAINLDYNNTLLYTVTRSLNVVTIEATQSNVIFSETTNTSSGRITTVITNETETASISIDNISFSTSTSTNYCKNVKVNVTTSSLATDISSPVVINGNVDNPFSFDYGRENVITITCTDGVNTASQTVALPDVLRTEKISISLFNTPNGSTATINFAGNAFLVTTPTISDSFLDLQYSLDNINWQTSNVFNGLAEGIYTVYIKDQYNCQISSSFQVNIFTPSTTVTTPYNYIDKALSIRYKRNQEWDNCSIYRTEENTLSCEEVVENAYPYYHLFQTCDTITTQFLSNYSNISANVIRENGSKDSLTVVKRSNNIGATDKRDAKYYNAENSQTGIYYTIGSTYNYSTGIANGTYELQGSLPQYGSIGNYIFLDGVGWFEIKDIIYNDVYDADVLIIDYEYTGSPSEAIVSSVYNIENYEVYEFTTDMSNYEDEEIQIEILQSDNSFGEYNYLSEKIKVTERWYDTLEIIWYNNTNTRTYYSTGLKNKARVYFETFYATDDSDLEIHKTDTTTILIDSESYETNTLVLDGHSLLSTGAKRQLTKAFMHKELYINKVKYVSNSIPETENIPYTNQYKLTANLTKTGNVFQSQLSGNENTISNVDVIGLLQTDGKYIKL